LLKRTSLVGGGKIYHRPQKWEGFGLKEIINIADIHGECGDVSKTFETTFDESLGLRDVKGIKVKVEDRYIRGKKYWNDKFDMGSLDFE